MVAMRERVYDLLGHLETNRNLKTESHYSDAFRFTPLKDRKKTCRLKAKSEEEEEEEKSI